jgi:hypothetical protein
MQMRSSDGYKPLYSQQLSPERWAQRERVVDATFRHLLVGTELSDAIILDIDSNIVCRRCKHFIIVFEVTCEHSIEKQCAVTTNLAKVLSENIAPTAAFVLQIHNYSNHSEKFTPKHLTLYPIYIPAALSSHNLPPVIHFNYEQFQKFVIETYKALHLPEICDKIKSGNIYVYAHKVNLASKWEGNEHEI